MTLSSLRSWKGCGSPVSSAVLACKSSGETIKLSRVRAARFEMRPPSSRFGGWEIQVVEYVEGDDERSIEAAAHMLVSILIEGLRHAAKANGKPLPMLGKNLPGTEFHLSPFVWQSDERITQGELLKILHVDEFRAALPKLTRSRVRGMDRQDEIHHTDVVKISSATSLVPWMNDSSQFNDALSGAAKNPDVLVKLKRVIKFAAVVRGGGFVTVMPNLAGTTVNVTYEMLRTKWRLFYQQVVRGMLIPLLEEGVVYYDLRTGQSNVRWSPPCKGGIDGDGEFLLWDLGSLLPDDCFRFTSGLPPDGRLPQLSQPHTRNYVFAQVVMLAFAAAKEVAESRFRETTALSSSEQGAFLWRIEAGDPTESPLRSEFDSWIEEVASARIPSLQGEVEQIRAGEEISASSLTLLERLFP